MPGFFFTYVVCQKFVKCLNFQKLSVLSDILSDIGHDQHPALDLAQNCIPVELGLRFGEQIYLLPDPAARAG